MRNNSSLWFEYTEMRRRIERRFANVQIVIGHLLAFLFAVMVVGSMQQNRIDLATGEAFIGINFMLWSLILLGHGMWAFRKSGASTKTREAAIIRQIDERIEQDDTALLNHRRDAFRLQGLMDEDIRKRSGAYFVMLLYMAMNAITWFSWLVQGADSSYPWRYVIPMAMFLLVPATIINKIRRSQRNSTYMNLFENWTFYSDSPVEKPKQKRAADDSTVRLSDDGELVEDFWADSSKAKRTG